MKRLIREYFCERSRRSLKASTIGIVVALPAMGFASAMREGLYQYLALGVAVCGVAVMYGGLLYLDRSRCPKCSARIGFRVNQYRLRLVRLPGRCRRIMDACPKCGTSFDEVMPSEYL
jgi:ribosomal protein S27AE